MGVSGKIKRSVLYLDWKPVSIAITLHNRTK